LSDSPRYQIEYFGTFEERENYVRSVIGAPVPQRHQGAAIFMSDFLKTRQWIGAKRRYSFITPNPLDCLAFDRPEVVLQAAISGTKNSVPNFLTSILEQFQLSHLLGRSIHTLSGGETFRLALAKTAIEAQSSADAIISSPWSWLSADNLPCLETLSRMCEKYNKSIEILSLTDEQDEEVFEFSHFEIPKLQFGIRLQSIRMGLREVGGGDSSSRVEIEDMAIELPSPCLIYGSNGNGKSLLAKILAGAVLFSGTAELIGSSSTKTRMVFQDVLNQAVMTSIAMNEHWETNSLPEFVFNKIMKTEVLSGLKSRSLLATKAQMVALRIQHKPGAIILDEPDWGLNRSDAISFLCSVFSICHELGIAVLVITHRNWFNQLFRSSVKVTKNNFSGRSFRIALNPAHEFGPMH